MDLSPNDIRNYEFPGQLRGYDKDAVDNFREQVAATLDAVKQENLRLAMEMESLKTQLSGLKQFEETIKSAAIDARRNADLTVSNAKQEAELILTKARAEAEKAVAARAQKISEIENQINKLELTRRSYLSKLKGLLTSHLELVTEIVRSDHAREPREESLDITDSSEVAAKTRETIATPPPKPKGLKAEEVSVSEEISPEPSPEPEHRPEDEQLTATDDDSYEHEPSPIDPELASALESYKRSAESSQPDTVLDVPIQPPAPRPGEVVETTARAEDIPDGFIAKEDGTGSDRADTDRVDMAPDAQDQPVEPNAIDTEAPPPEKKPAPPEDLDKSLDEVVAKFEEEMDKAAKN